MRFALQLLAGLHGGGQALAGKLWLVPRIRDRRHLLPLIVVGGLRAGGSGKTALTLELARRLVGRGLRVGVMAYRIGRRLPGFRTAGTDPNEVTPGSDWRFSSDEAVLLAENSGARVFVTRNREKAWDALSRSGEFDVFLSDDGLADPRLGGAWRMALRAPGENPCWRDLLPAGPYRHTSAMLGRVDCMVEGPAPSAEARASGFWFRRILVFPPEFDRARPCWVLTGMGNPDRFLSDLRTSGVRVQGISSGRDHGMPSARELEGALSSGAPLLCTVKDAVKLRSLLAERGKTPYVVRERVDLSPGLEGAVLAHIAKPRTS